MFIFALSPSWNSHGEPMAKTVSTEQKKISLYNLLGTKDWLHGEKFLHGPEGEWSCILPASAGWGFTCRSPVLVHGPGVEVPCFKIRRAKSNFQQLWLWARNEMKAISWKHQHSDVTVWTMQILAMFLLWRIRWWVLNILV